MTIHARPLALTLTLVLALPAVGQSKEEFQSLEEALAIAQATNPMLRAARLRADASLSRVPQAGALPDPMLSFGFMNRPVDDLGRTDQQMTMNVAQLPQRFPWPGKLGFSEERARLLASAEELEAEETEQQLLARVRDGRHAREEEVSPGHLGNISSALSFCWGHCCCNWVHNPGSFQ